MNVYHTVQFSFRWCFILLPMFLVPKVGAQRYEWRTFAGNEGGEGLTDGPAGDARFNDPVGIAVNAAGDMFVADSDNNSIRRITPAGVVSTFAGTPPVSGTADGPVATAQFRRPWYLAFDPLGNLYVGDFDNSAIRKITPAGIVSTMPGFQPNLAGMACDAAGNLYYVQVSEHVVRRMSPAGVQTNVAGSPGVRGSTNGNGSAARFDFLHGLAISPGGDIFVSETFSHTIRRVTPAGDVTTFAGSAGNSGSADGTGSAARFRSPRGLAFDAAGNLYVNDSENFTVRRITPAGVVTTVAGTALGSGTADGTGASARFSGGWGLARLPGGDLLIADKLSHSLRRMTPSGVVTTLAGKPKLTGTANGTGTAARFRQPRAVATDGDGNVYVTDNHAVRRITPEAVVTTLAGSPGNSGNSDGTGTAARFNDPIGMTADAAGHLYVADWANHTIRKVTPAGVVTTIAGSAGTSGFVNGTAAAARFFNPMGLVFDGSGNLLIADQNNHAIRRLSPAGAVTTMAGGSAGTADGSGTTARFFGPSSIAKIGRAHV